MTKSMRGQVRIYKSKPDSSWTASDPARDAQQARELAKNYPADMQVRAVKTGKRGDVFPYTIYVHENVHVRDGKVYKY